MKIYISGHIALNREKAERFFRQHAARVTTRGHSAVVPQDIEPDHRADVDGECPKAYTPSAACHLRADFRALLDCDGILMIGDWHSSVGATREHDVAMWAGLQIFYAVESIPELPTRSMTIENEALRIAYAGTSAPKADTVAETPKWSIGPFRALPAEIRHAPFQNLLKVDGGTVLVTTSIVFTPDPLPQPVVPEVTEDDEDDYPYDNSEYNDE